MVHSQPLLLFFGGLKDAKCVNSGYSIGSLDLVKKKFETIKKKMVFLRLKIILYNYKTQVLFV